MIRHCVAHPFGAAVGRSSQQAALLEPDEGSHPPSMGIRFCCATRCKKPTLRSVFQFGGGSGLTRAIPGARPAGSLRLSKGAVLPSCRTRVRTEPPITK